MKKHFYNMLAVIAGLVIISTNCFAQANTTLSNLVAPTAVNKNLLPETDNSKNLGSAGKSWKDFYLDGIIYLDGSKFIANTGTDNTFIGAATGAASTGSGNTFVGSLAGYTNTTGFNNSFSGVKAGYSNTTGYYNSAFGAFALYLNTDGFYNSALGHNALYSNTTGTHNSAFGKDALYSNSTGVRNSAFGTAALSSNTTGYYNSAFGNSALTFNSTGYENSAFGHEALYSNTTGANNVAIGSQALYSNTTGSFNSAVGNYVLTFNNIGSYNSAFGTFALTNNTGSDNSAFGYYALYTNTSGHHNAAFGEYAGRFTTEGAYNSCFGVTSGYNVTTGNTNTFIGNSAGDVVTTGSSNTCVGALTDIDAATYTNSTTLGYDASATASNQVRIGNAAITSIGGYEDWTNISDGRFKRNVSENIPGLQFITRLRPVSYTLDVIGINRFISSMNDFENTAIDEAVAVKEKVVYTGFIAQEVEEAGESIGFRFSGVDVPGNEKDLYGLRYAQFVVPLVKAVQELDEENGKLKMENSELRDQVAKLNEAVFGVKTSSGSEIKSETILGQNIPNPFANSTVIPFRIPEDCSSGSIMITNTSTSQVIRVIPISCNEDHLSVDASTLASGTYSYALFVDGKLIDRKEMVITK